MWFLITTMKFYCWKPFETRKRSGLGNWKHDTFFFGLLWTKCRLTLTSQSLILPIWPILFINVTKLICTRFFLMVFNATFNNISVISWWSVLLVEETGGPGENHRPVASHWQTLSHNLVHLALIEIWIHNMISYPCLFYLSHIHKEKS
jgi:hypothetical protein